MAVFATTTWARKAGLTVGDKDWEIRFQLRADGKHPTGETSSNRTTSFWMLLAKEMYWVDYQSGGRRGSLVIDNTGSELWHHDELRLPIPDLADFATWFAGLEETIGKAFDRNKIWVQSNVKGGRDAVVTWIENGFTWPSARPKAARTATRPRRASRRQSG